MVILPGQATIYANICIVNVPANMTKFYQPLDLKVNGYAKRFLKRKFNEWYSGQVKTQLDKGINIEDVTSRSAVNKIEAHSIYYSNIFFVEYIYSISIFLSG